MEQRRWTHEESPNGVPSASAFRLGCKCEDCRQANIKYMQAYHARKVALEDNPDGTTHWHSHKGAPSASTAKKWGCIHPRCLKLAGLYYNAATGEVRYRADDTVADGFGLPVAV